jgi:nucleoside-diphosphate-sugar epimerase
VGGAGFIGHHLALRLRQQHEVLIVDSLSVNNRYADGHSPQAHAILDERFVLLRDVPTIVQDARDYHALSRVLGRFRPDCIVHLAAVAHLDRANKDPHSTFDHSLRTLENCLDVARSIGTPHLVYFSSSTIYGDFSAPTVDERVVPNPRGIYGAVKLAGEHIVRAYGETGGPEWTIVRPCALYGPRCVSGRVIQKFIEAARSGETLNVVPGKVDFTYVDDLVAGVELVIEKAAARNQCFNITAGEGRSLVDVAGIIQRHYAAKWTIGELDPQRPMRGTLSCQLAKDLLGYVPQYKIERGIPEYIAWYEAFSRAKTAA